MYISIFAPVMLHCFLLFTDMPNIAHWFNFYLLLHDWMDNETYE